MKGIPLLL